jgi:ATP-dependent exoDNAse (exonuclease V) beta subunit
LEDARLAYACLAELLLTKDGAVRTQIDVRNGFPADRKREKERMKALLQQLRDEPAIVESLHAAREIPPARYTAADWEIVRACFTLLRHAAAELKVIFAEAGTVDFIEVAHLAQHVLREADSSPSDAAIALADTIHHLLIDEFQDTSRRQHALVASLVAAWPDAAERSLFVVGDPMQSIYSFRDADAELFPRVQVTGLELPNDEPLVLDFVELTSNFRSAPDLVSALNDNFEKIFAREDGSGVQFSIAHPARLTADPEGNALHVHVEFIPQLPYGGATSADALRQKDECRRLREAAQAAQVEEIVALIRSHSDKLQSARAHEKQYRIAVLGRARSALTPVAAALRNAGIRYRAVDLEPLAERPEVLDAIALARALLLPEDRVAWLGVLRAPWCGLSLEDLHRLTSGDDPELLCRPVPQLMAERSALLSESGQRAVTRVLRVSREFSALRAAHSASALGTLVEQAWLGLGGEACVDATALTNLRLLWSCLDRLTAGVPGLLAQELDGALARLMAQPDPQAESDYGVQLMTIHKSKGLEFEVVIVPDLQAKGATSQSKLLSWLERGLAAPGEDDELTEFLIAPVQSKGEDRGKAKVWVDRMSRARETQEMRRILYVAATRARQELHLFARPAYKSADSEFSLCGPGSGLLSTAWPAVEGGVVARFEAWRAAQETEVLSLAAAAQENVVQMPVPRKPAILRHLPDDFEAAIPARATGASASMVANAEAVLYRRHEGGAVSRALGSAIHALLEHTADLRAKMTAQDARRALPACAPGTIALIRAAGMSRQQAEELAGQAVSSVLRAMDDPIAEWILAPHPEAASETQWTGVIDGVARTVRADRVFRAGNVPRTESGSVWWVVDYKTAHAEGETETLLAKLRPLFAPQLETYAQFLRKLHGADIEVRAGLYYPRLLAFDWWIA